MQFLALPVCIAAALVSFLVLSATAEDCSHRDQLPCPEHVWRETGGGETVFSHYEFEPVLETALPTVSTRKPASNCNWFDCDSDCPPPGTEVVGTLAEADKFCWSVGGSASVTVKLGLAVRLLQRIGVGAELQVEINGEVSGCETYSDTWTVRFQPSQCWHQTAFLDRTKKTVEGKAVYVERKFWHRCRPLSAGGCETRETECEDVRAQGKADNKFKDGVIRDVQERCCQDPPDPAPPCCGCCAAS